MITFAIIVGAVTIGASILGGCYLIARAIAENNRISREENDRLARAEADQRQNNNRQAAEIKAQQLRYETAFTIIQNLNRRLEAADARLAELRAQQNNTVEVIVDCERRFQALTVDIAQLAGQQLEDGLQRLLNTITEGIRGNIQELQEIRRFAMRAEVPIAQNLFNNAFPADNDLELKEEEDVAELNFEEEELHGYRP